MKYTPNKIKEFVKDYVPRLDYRPGNLQTITPVVQRVILKKLVNATIDSGCRIIWFSS